LRSLRILRWQRELGIGWRTTPGQRIKETPTLRWWRLSIEPLWRKAMIPERTSIGKSWTVEFPRPFRIVRRDREGRSCRETGSAESPMGQGRDFDHPEGLTPT